MKFEKLFEDLDTRLRQHSTDFEQMRNLLAQIKETRDVCRWMDSAQDQLYASIASAHLKVLSHLEEGKIDDAKREASAAIRWFHLRFQFFPPDTRGKIPEITETFKAIAAAAEKSAALREALAMTREDVASKFSPAGKK